MLFRSLKKLWTFIPYIDVLYYMNNLNTYIRMADGIDALMHPHAEVVIHDLAIQKVVYIANNYSNRDIGSPSYVDEIDFAESDKLIGPYSKTNWDGRDLKSVTIVMNGSDGKPEALICINLDISEFKLMHQMLGQILTSQTEDVQVDALFRDDWHERINQSIQEWLHKQNLTLKGLSRSEKREIGRAHV